MVSNTRFRKLGSLFASAALIFSLAACSGSSTSSKESKDNSNKAYPEKPIVVTAPSGAGGGLDTTARALSKVLQETGLSKTALSVENKPGGGQAVGLADFVGQDSKDPYRLYLPSVPLLINNLKKEGNSPYSYRDLTPLAQLTKDYGAIVVPADSKYKDLKSLFEDLKKNPSSLTLAGGSAPGSQDHLVAMLPAVKAGVDATKIKYVSYDGGGEAMTALIGGNADVLATDISGTGEYLKAGRVRVLGVSSPQRLKGLYADIPTYKEEGIDAEFTIWRGLFGPKDMPDYAVDYWNKTLTKMSQTSEWKQVLETNGWEDGYKNSSDFAAFLKEQEKLVKEILTSLNMVK
ncbi:MULTISPECIES: tripartite tricarboxylate transporter substrate binding protein [Neobacillus]|uniref:Tripartite tricarboxylate transporter substrate binding protein n=1 Tax=Neobacillus rhizophilus TaxID=2833579 RepID=A0A942U4H0_9BACI|nr:MULTISPECIES: tripartite tricarboxylate transporter substrate binding protein [Neobacillus]MBS4214525.1 tripartite tricarboxylate transporter substrate binding protein [Neobacillus rhizophilus]MBU8918430.1 tripartite tricarboxylate transporter substrate binding protein [Bacillus sp. FJAT-29953]